MRKLKFSLLLVIFVMMSQSCSQMTALQGQNPGPIGKDKAHAGTQTPVSYSATIGSPFVLASSAANGYHYGYAPAIIRTLGQYHTYFCSTGNGSDTDMDNLRHIVSYDLLSWTPPSIISTPTPVERSNCDPSVVLYDAGDGPYYYIFYSGTAVNVQTLNFVERSQSPNGAFLKFTDRGTWESQPKDPHAIIWPTQNSSSPNVYGAGEPTVVVKDNALYMWYTDTTYISGKTSLLLTVSNNAVSWSAPILTNVTDGSVDVKYDPKTQQFVMFKIHNGSLQNAELAMTTSTDGITWTTDQVICDQNCFPHWANNVGVSGDDQGHLINSSALVSYGAPYGLSASYNNDCSVSPAPYCWGYWNLYGSVVHLSIESGSTSLASSGTTANVAVPASSTTTSSASTCVASGTDQTYLNTALLYFQGAINTPAAATAGICYGNLENALAVFEATNWPCGPTTVTIDYVSTCVKLVGEIVNQ